MANGTLANGWMGLVGILLVGLALLIALRKAPGLRGWRWRWRLSRIIRRGARSVYRRLDLPDGMDGRVLVEYALLTPAGIVVLDLRPYPGAVFAAQDVEQWAQIVGGRSFHFANPIRDLERQLAAVRLRVGQGVSLHGLLVFSDDADFPKGRPECVVRLDELARLLSRSRKDTVDPALDQAWRSLTRGAEQAP